MYCYTWRNSGTQNVERRDGRRAEWGKKPAQTTERTYKYKSKIIQWEIGLDCAEPSVDFSEWQTQLWKNCRRQKSNIIFSSPFFVFHFVVFSYGQPGLMLIWNICVYIKLYDTDLNDMIRMSGKGGDAFLPRNKKAKRNSPFIQFEYKEMFRMQHEFSAPNGMGRIKVHVIPPAPIWQRKQKKQFNIIIYFQTSVKFLTFSHQFKCK